MIDAWETLRAAGVPDGAVRPLCEGYLDATVATALIEVTPAVEGSPEAEPLLAWLAAFRDHWPTRFGALLGTAGEDALERLQRGTVDRGRYLKLRRIAIDNLAALLR